MYFVPNLVEAPNVTHFSNSAISPVVIINNIEIIILYIETKLFGILQSALINLVSFETLKQEIIITGKRNKEI